MSEFLSMGGYGFYIWGAYGVTALVIAGELIALRARRRAAETLATGTPRSKDAR
ncbi:MAG: heme exporter protein CcmD [Casimicrobiaceae bacterium]